MKVTTQTKSIQGASPDNGNTGIMAQNFIVNGRQVSSGVFVWNADGVWGDIFIGGTKNSIGGRGFRMADVLAEGARIVERHVRGVTV